MSDSLPKGSQALPLGFSHLSELLVPLVRELVMQVDRPVDLRKRQADQNEASEDLDLAG